MKKTKKDATPASIALRGGEDKRASLPSSVFEKKKRWHPLFAGTFQLTGYSPADKKLRSN